MISCAGEKAENIVHRFRFWGAASTIMLFGAVGGGLTAQSLTTLASFSGTELPVPNVVIQATDGNFYGTTAEGGLGVCISFGINDGCGTIFKVTPGGTLTTLYNFGLVATDGSHPSALIQATDGNFYGTTSFGGPMNAGTIFMMTPSGTLTTLYSFGEDSLGSDPTGLIQASDGNFYGTTANGSTVFKFTPMGQLIVLHAFTGPDGSSPTAGVIQATDGNFYGTTQYGGTGNCPGAEANVNGCGTIFKITPDGTFTTLHSFNVTDGSNPSAGLIQATDGNFYGSSETGGTGDCQDKALPNSGCGTIFKITPAGTLTTLYVFGASVADGIYFIGVRLVQAADGDFYGTTLYGGINRCASGTGVGCGTIFRMTSGGTLTTLYAFGACPSDGLLPSAGMIQATDGDFYGTTVSGGANQLGTVFRFTLESPPAITGVVNGASFEAGIVADSWITITGAKLSLETDSWANTIVNGELPTQLNEVTVMVGQQLAYVAYISPTQINALAPNVPVGGATVTVTNSIGNATVLALVQTTQPAFFQWGNYAVATRQDYSLAVKNGTINGVTTEPAKPGDVIILWGTGFGATNPPAAEGIEVPSNTIYNTANPVTVAVGGQSATVYGAALAPGFVGLYQVAIQIPTSLGNGDYPVVATESGMQSPMGALITVQD